MLGTIAQNSRLSGEIHPPEPAPIFLVVIDEDRRLRVGENISDPAQAHEVSLLGLVVERVIDGRADQNEADWNQRWPRAIGGREVGDPRRVDDSP
jgi:hypothetical protein